MHGRASVATDHGFLLGGGAVGALMRAHDWSASPLGDPGTWPQALRLTVGLMLNSAFPMFVAWGPDLGFLYNDAYVEILGGKHPSALGARFHDIWSEIWDDIAPLIDAAMSGHASYREDLPLLMNRKGYGEQTWFTFSYSPVRDERGAVAGMFCACTETTAKVLSERRQAFRLRIEEGLRDRSDPVAMMEAATRLLAEHLRVAQVGFGEVDAAEAHVTIHRDWNDGRLPSVAGTWRMDDFGPAFIAEMRAGATIAIPDVREDPRTNDPGVLAAYEGIRTRAVLDVPFLRDGRMAAMLFTHDPEPRSWTPDEIALVEETCGRLWDAVERSRAEAERRRSEARLTRALVAARLGTFEWNLLTDAVALDPRSRELFGFAPDEGRTAQEVFDRIHPDDLPRVLAEVRASSAALSRLETEYRICPPGGTMRAIVSLSDALAGGSGTAESLVGVLADISERKAAQERLRELNETLEHQVEERTAERNRVWTMSRDLLAVMGFDGYLKAVNPAWEATLGLDRSTLLARPFPEQVHPDDLAPAAAVLDRLRRGETVDRFEDRLRHADGSWRWIAWTLVPGEEVFYAVGRDVTAEKASAAELERAQEALRQAQKMEAVGQLTGGVAHDFNNLLTIIKSSTDLLRRPNLPEERRDRYIAAISDTVDRAAKLTGQLLSFARRQALKPEVFDASERVRAVGDMLRTIMGSRIRIQTETPSHPCPVEADVNQFETALVNMAVNARDAMNGEGALTVRVWEASGLPPIRGHTGGPGPFVAVALTDTGAGIAPDKLSQIFEPFFTTKEVGKGTGLGLSMVYGFAKQSHGDVAVDSAVGRGTTFTLYLPRTERPERSAAAVVKPPAPREDGRGRRVLIVEDNVEVGTFSTQLLQDLGYETTWAANGAEALTVLDRTSDFDVVFSDVIMPGMSGVELGEEIRRRHPGLPVVLTSGYSHVLAEEGRHGFELLHKPYAVEDVSRVLRRATQARTASSRPE